MPETQSTKIVYSLQAVLVLSMMFMMLSAAMFGGIVYVHNSQQIKKPASPLGSVGEMSMEAIEATYGPVNKEALLERKDGLFARIRAARQGCQPCAPQRQQAYCSPVSRSYTTSYSRYVITDPVAYPVVIHPTYPLASPSYPAIQPGPSQTPSYVQPAPLKIQPSTNSDCADGSCNQGNIQSDSFKPSL